MSLNARGYPPFGSCHKYVGARAADGGRPCGHRLEDHVGEPSVCARCRAEGVPESTRLITGFDHRFHPGFDGGSRASRTAERLAREVQEIEEEEAA